MATQKPLILSAAQLCQIVAGDTLDPATLGTGTRDGTKFLCDDGVWRVGSYSLPIASASVLGGVKVGSGLSIDGAGVLSASGGGGLSHVNTAVLRTLRNYQGGSWDYNSSFAQLNAYGNTDAMQKDSYGYWTWINGGYQSGAMQNARGAILMPFAPNFVSAEVMCFPYRVGGGSAPQGSTFGMRLHFVKTSGTGNSVVVTKDVTITTTQFLNQNQGQGSNTASLANILNSALSGISAGDIIGLSCTILDTNWAVWSDLMVNVVFKQEA